jgi:sodium-coupled neutral amino acid transporter 11
MVWFSRWYICLYCLQLFFTEDLMSIPFGSYGSYFVLINMFILAYGAMVAYLLIIKDTVPVVLDMVDTGDGNFWERELIMIVTSLVIVVPLSMARDMASLAATSLLSVVADAILVGFVIGFSPVRSTVSEYGGFVKVLEDNWINSKLFIGLGVLSTAMACQHSAFIVSGSLENKTALRWSMVTSRSISISAAMCIMMGVTGYLGFLGATEGDVLNNFDSDSFEANAGRTLLAVTMFFTYPMECFVARHVLVKLIYNGNMDNETVGPSGETIPEVKLFGFLGRREKVTLGIYVATLIPALIVDDLGPVLSLTGSLGASCIAYIGPGLVYFGVNGEDFLIFTAKMLEDQGYKTNRKSIENGQVEELPVAGVSGAKIEMKPEPSYPQGSKPWWWYLGGFSIWCSIASYGALGTKTFLSEMEVDRGMSLQSASEDEQEEVIGPCRRDYYISMFFIIFGVIAMVVGVACNVYGTYHILAITVLTCLTCRNNRFTNHLSLLLDTAPMHY